MLSVTDLPGRTVHVVAPRHVDPRWPDPVDRARAVVATLDVLRPVTGSLVLDVASDRWNERDGTLLPIDLHDQQRWAEQDLRELPAPTRTGRWPGAVWVDARDDELWMTARTYATASLGTRVLDDDERPLAEFDDGGTVITAALTSADVLTLRRPARNSWSHPWTSADAGDSERSWPRRTTAGSGVDRPGSTTSTPTAATAGGTDSTRGSPRLRNPIRRTLSPSTSPSRPGVHDGREPARVVGTSAAGTPLDPAPPTTSSASRGRLRRPPQRDRGRLVPRRRSPGRVPGLVPVPTRDRPGRLAPRRPHGRRSRRPRRPAAVERRLGDVHPVGRLVGPRPNARRRRNSRSRPRSAGSARPWPTAR